ncbi:MULTISPECIES: hypothetical protein [Proteiniphilum]|jgi:hypothetical protein|uniref:hypothetical protein n=1 Tax=Proteiniphilum TaxID=294702 RepID=UPI000ECC74AC|nr:MULTISPECIES: hypothetical protein [Proteiniphilum]ULB33721.1 hypothetical protein KDN43_12045 [Proteiniphilum propionicum]HCM21941.1 hypothetical protein [Porphyromonadaceae bacterium]
MFVFQNHALWHVPANIPFPFPNWEDLKKLRLELESKPELDDFDIETAVITLKQRKQPYTAQPENLEKALASLKQYISRNGITEPVELSKREMSDILCISRPTVDKRIDAGIIVDEIAYTFRGVEVYSYTTRSVLKCWKS